LKLLQSEKFDVCFFDFLMPVMNGLEAVIRFSRWAKHLNSKVSESTNVQEQDVLVVNSDLLIVGMSGNPNDAEVKSAFKYGMHFYFNKPLKKEVVLGIVNARKNASSLNEALATLGHDQNNLRLMRTTEASSNSAD
jgi:CheY-like chemotaxis protein